MTINAGDTSALARFEEVKEKLAVNTVAAEFEFRTRLCVNAV